MLASFGAIGLNVALNYVLIFQAGLGHRGLALSTTLSATANFLVLFFVMRRQLGGFEGGALLRNLLSCGLAGAALAGTAWLGREWMSGWWEGADLLRRALGLLAVIGGSGMTYAVLCWLLRVPEIMTARELLQRRLARFQRPR
jgi:putative peptidoglycan lipid II flippase